MNLHCALESLLIWARAWEWIFPGDLAVDEGQYQRAAELYGTALRHYQRVSFRAGMILLTVTPAQAGVQGPTVER